MCQNKITEGVQKVHMNNHLQKNHAKSTYSFKVIPKKEQNFDLNVFFLFFQFLVRRLRRNKDFR